MLDSAVFLTFGFVLTLFLFDITRRTELCPRCRYYLRWRQRMGGKIPELGEPWDLSPQTTKPQKYKFSATPLSIPKRTPFHLTKSAH